MPRESWTDERLDDFRGEVSRRLDETNRRIDETNQRIDETNRRLDAGFARMDARFDAMQRTLMTIGFVLSAALIGVIATQL